MFQHDFFYRVFFTVPSTPSEMVIRGTASALLTRLFCVDLVTFSRGGLAVETFAVNRQYIIRNRHRESVHDVLFPPRPPSLSHANCTLPKGVGGPERGV